MTKLRDWIRDAIHDEEGEARTVLLAGFFVVVVAGLVWGWLQVKSWSDSINHIPH